MRILVAALTVIVLAAGTAAAQRGRFGRASVSIASERDFDGTFHFCRVMYNGNPYGDGGFWDVDFPYADINVSVRLSELTKTNVSLDPSGEPKHLVLRLTDDALFNCPFVMMTEVAAASLNSMEAVRLRAYVEKGGFVWADDFWGTYAWDVWERELRKAFPRNEFPIVDIGKDHPIWRTHLVVPGGLPQIPSIGHWRGSGGDTSELGPDSRDAHARAILDSHGRIMVLMTHNTDIGDSWEREGEDPEYFMNFSVPGYAVGLNVILYSMMH